MKSTALPYDNSVSEHGKGNMMGIWHYPVLDIKKLTEEAIVPEYKTDGASGLDLCSTVETTIGTGERILVPTGIAVDIPHGFEGQVRPRSGVSLNIGLVAILGTIDSDYRGEVGVILSNIGNERIVIRKGDRVAQLVISPVAYATINVVRTLSKTERGEGGFGSTGK
jgi:dUTP pyrophosphatase